MEGRAVFEDGMTKMVTEVEVKKVLYSKQKNKAPGAVCTVLEYPSYLKCFV